MLFQTNFPKFVVGKFGDDPQRAQTIEYHSKSILRVCKKFSSPFFFIHSETKELSLTPCRNQPTICRRLSYSLLHFAHLALLLH